MAGFRLKMATQHGEKVAEEFGFNQFPVRPREIAKARDIVIQAKPAEVTGVSGAIIFAGYFLRSELSQPHSLLVQTSWLAVPSGFR